jgi:adenylate kinase
MKILMLGPQGSGKGTQAKRIGADYGLAHIATGDMLRAAIAAGTDLGRRVGEFVDRGALVPDALMIDLIRERLAQEDAQDGFVLDGFPRTMAQAEALDALLAAERREPDVVLLLMVPDEVSVERLLERARIEGRTDDTPEVIRRRLETYHRETEPLVERYRAGGSLVPIHGDRRPDEVFAEIQQALDELERRGAGGRDGRADATLAGEGRRGGAGVSRS